MDDHFGVGFSPEHVALSRELRLEPEIVLDDPVVNQDDASRGVAVRVRVFLGRAAMGGPARVPDGIGAAIDRVLADCFLKVSQLARCAPEFECLARAAAHRDACRVVPAVLQTAQTLNDNGDNGF